jgi:aryl-alcohol dehydrogenase-like predicted oxidoreductase
VLGYGNFNSHEIIPLDEQVKIIKTCLEHGVNHFDTAEVYTNGQDEEDLGKVLKQINEPRELLVICTKVWKAPVGGLNGNGNTNKKHIRESLKSSLKRLQLDYVDVVYAHHFDESTPIEETCRGFHDLIEDGLAFYWGTSNWDADQVIQALQICEQYNLHKPITTQSQYNMINRS